MSEPFQKAPLMPETRSSATDHVMSQTSLNKGQRQMDSVLKSWGFRTSRDPFQQNSSQALEGNKGQKSTPLREVVCLGTFLKKNPPGFALWNVMTVHSTKALPYRTVDTTSEVALSTTLYVHIFAFDLARAERYAVNSVAKESSLTQWSGASCICTLNRSGSPGEYTGKKVGPLLVATEPPEEPHDFSTF